MMMKIQHEPATPSPSLEKARGIEQCPSRESIASIYIASKYALFILRL